MSIECLRRDLLLAVRSLSRRPGYAAVVALTLGLGIGANTAVFSVVDAVLLRPLPYAAPDRLAAVWAELPEQGRLDAHLSGPDLAAIWEGARSFESVGAVWARPGVLRGDGPAEEVEVGWITPGFLEALGVNPLLGRLPTPDELVADPVEVMVLSYELWHGRYGADPAILGRLVRFDDEPRRVVGVMPRGFRMLLPPDQGVPERLAAWLPWGGRGYGAMPASFRVFTPVARLAPGVALEQAAEEMRALANRVRAGSVEYGRSGFGLRLEPLAPGVVAHVRATLLVLLGVVGLVLLVACANVANLALARAAEAERDLRVRAALGASRAGLLRQMLAESGVIGGLGAASGLVLADVGLALVRWLEPGRLPRGDEVSLDARALAYAAATTLAGSLLFGVLAAVQALRGAERTPLRDGARTEAPRTGRVRRVLVVSELALSLVLLAGAGLLVRSFATLSAVDPGFDPDGVLTARISLPDVHYRYRDQGPKIAAFYRRLDERLGSLPGVEAAGATTRPPLSGAALRTKPVAWRTASGEVEWGSVSADYSTVTPGWFRAAGVRLQAGRVFSDADDRDHPLAVVVDSSLARRAWPEEDAVGRPIRVEVFRDGEFRPEWGEVIGVVRTVHLDRLETPPSAQVYLAHAQAPQRTMYPTLKARLARTRGGEAAGEAVDPLSLVPALQAQVAGLESDLPVFDVRLADEYVSEATAVSRFALFTLAAFASVAVLLAAAGVYAVMAHAVAGRRFEIGVRLALGASPRSILALVLAQGMRLTGAGIVAGLVGGLAIGRVLSGLLFGVGPRDPLTFASAALLLAATALAACWAPARRASRVEPREALRA